MVWTGQGIGTIFTAILLFVPVFTQEGFHDEWTPEIRATFESCQRQLPNRVAGEDMKFILSHRDWYCKYMDQIFFFRVINDILDSSGNETVKSTTCLFESPCFLTSPFQEFNSTILTCTGSALRNINRVRPDGIVEAQVLKPNGDPDFKYIMVFAYTDRKSFVVNLFCFEDGTSGFTVGTTRPELSPHAKHLVKDYLDNAGFKDSFRLATTYDAETCQNKIEKPIWSPETVQQIMSRFHLKSLE